MSKFRVQPSIYTQASELFDLLRDLSPEPYTQNTHTTTQDYHIFSTPSKHTIAPEFQQFVHESLNQAFVMTQSSQPNE